MDRHRRQAVSSSFDRAIEMGARRAPADKPIHGSNSVIFRAADRDFTRADAVLVADRRSALEPVRHDVRVGLASARYAEDEDYELTPGAVTAAADTYRSEHDLTTAEETEQWLADHEVLLEDFAAWLERLLWRHRFMTDLDVVERDHRPGEREVDDLVWPELVFGNHLGRLARDLAALVAASLAAGRHVGNGWANDLPAMVQLLDQAVRAVTSPDRVAREIDARAGTLLTFDLELASFSAPDVAREAWLCIVEDGETLRAICHRAGGRLEQRRRFLDALPDALRGVVLSARPGDVLPPVATENGHVICRVVEKRTPGIDDDDVRQRVEAALGERAIDDLIGRHVRWSRG